jgi:hypothetical protein
VFISWVGYIWLAHNSKIQGSVMNFLKIFFSIIIFSIPKIGFACATCYGAPDAPATQGLNYAIFVLLGCISAVLMGVVFTIISLRNRAKACVLQSSGTQNRVY